MTRPRRLHRQNAISVTPNATLIVRAEAHVSVQAPMGTPTTDAMSKKRTGRHCTAVRSRKRSSSALVAPTRPISGMTRRGSVNNTKTGTLTKTSPNPNAARTITAPNTTPRMRADGSAAVAKKASMDPGSSRDAGFEVNGEPKAPKDTERWSKSMGFSVSVFRIGMIQQRCFPHRPRLRGRRRLAW